MRGNEFLDKMELVDAAFVKKADEKPMNKSYRWIKYGAVAACFCLIVIGSFSYWKSKDIHHTSTVLEKISIPDLNSGGMGYEAYLYYDASELNNGNPWNENINIKELPVYINKSYDDSMAGIPKGLSEEEMWALLESTALALDVEIISTEFIDRDNDDSNFTATDLHAVTSNGKIYIQADGGVEYYLPDDGLALPVEYSFTDYQTTESEAQETLSYLTTLYSNLLDMKNPTAITWGDYTFSGDYYRRYTVYDWSGNDMEDILNYNMQSVSFYPNDKEDLYLIRIQNSLTVAEKLGDYPIISVREAKKKLLDGNYQTSVPYDMPGKEYIVKVELIYRTGRLEEMLIPYYRFYVLLPEEARDNGLQSYGAYYVPAIADEYVENMPVYDGRFN